MALLRRVRVAVRNLRLSRQEETFAVPLEAFALKYTALDSAHANAALGLLSLLHPV